VQFTSDDASAIAERLRDGDGLLLTDEEINVVGTWLGDTPEDDTQTFRDQKIIVAYHLGSGQNTWPRLVGKLRELKAARAMEVNEMLPQMAKALLAIGKLELEERKKISWREEPEGKLRIEAKGLSPEAASQFKTAMNAAGILNYTI
jgi:hypothetical protein